MSTEEKLAYVFDLKQMGVDFITGVAMHFAFKGVSAVREKLPWNKGGSYSVGDATFMDSDDSFLGIFRNEQMLMPMDIMIL